MVEPWALAMELGRIQRRILGAAHDTGVAQSLLGVEPLCTLDHDHAQHGAGDKDLAAAMRELLRHGQDTLRRAVEDLERCL
jgi:hypothetical protein